METKKLYCNYRFCSCKKRSLPKIKADAMYKTWKRQMHKKCYMEWSNLSFNPDYKFINPLNQQEIE